ncbi:MAG: NAD(P)-binding domain-containing protein, partial [Sphingomonadaceae bacterium]
MGYIGLGNIGLPMAERLVGPDFDLIVHDAVPAAAEALRGRAAIARD